MSTRRYSFSGVGTDDGQLLETDKTYIETEVIEEMAQNLVARNVFPIQTLPDIGVKNWTVYTRSSMGAAMIDMDGQNNSKDRTKKTAHTVIVPMLHKGFELMRRDIAASRRNGMPIDISEAIDAALQIAEEEDKLLLSGEYTGFSAYGIEGLASATGRNTEASSGAWSTATNILKDVADAKAELVADGFKGPYDLIVRSDADADLDLLIANTGFTAREKVLPMLKGGQIWVSDNLYASNGAVTSAILCQPGKNNFVAGVPPETMSPQLSQLQLSHHKYDYDVWEIITPHIKRAKSICEITGITV